MISYPVAYLGCPVGGQNGVAPTAGAISTARLKGRPVSRYKDANPKDTTTLHFVFSPVQFSAWSSFWRAIDNGLTPFSVPILIDALPAVDALVQATGPWSSTTDHNGVYQVSLPVQVMG